MLNIAISNATIPHASDASTAPISTTNAQNSYGYVPMILPGSGERIPSPPL